MALVSLICAGLMINTVARITPYERGLIRPSADGRSTSPDKLRWIHGGRTKPGLMHPAGVRVSAGAGAVKDTRRRKCAPVIVAPLADNTPHAFSGQSIAAGVDASEKPSAIRDAVRTIFF